MKNTPQKINIHILVEGGNVQEVRSDSPNVEIHLFDVDNMREDFSEEEIDKKWDGVKKKTKSVF